MMRLVWIVFLVAVGWTLPAATVSAAETVIRCPLPQATRSVTERLPPDWWTTPVASRLTGTRIQQIGGRPALMCLYGEAGSIQRNVPHGQACTAIRGGFRCVDGAAERERGAGTPPAPDVLSSGTIVVRETYMFDLDSGREQTRGADFWFQATDAAHLYLTPKNGALISIGNKRNRGVAGCRRARYSEGRVALRKIPVGSYVCARTSEGRTSQFRVTGLSAGSPKTLRLSFTTWR